VADSDLATAPGSGDFAFDPYSMEYAIDPYPFYEWMRENAPVYHHREMDFYILSRYEDVWKAHRDAAIYSSAAGVTIERQDNAGLILLGKDAPDHGWAKAMMTKVFSRERMEALDPFIRQRAVDLLEGAYQRHGPHGEWDMVSEFSVELPLYVISELLGIPEELRAEVHHQANKFLARGDGSTQEVQLEANMGLFGLFHELTQARRAEPKDDPVSLLIALQIEDEAGTMRQLDDTEIAMRFLEMAIAGHETVAKAIPSGAMAMELFPAEKAKLRSDSGKIPQAVQEVLRFDPPSQLQGRCTTREVTLHGVTIPADKRVMLATGSATRDPRAFPDPDRFDIDRDNDSRTVFFGYGVHKCLGIHLAQREIAIAFEELFTRFPDWQVDPARATRVAVTNVRGVAGLPIMLGKHA
jgi:cytochrome P450